MKTFHPLYECKQSMNQKNLAIIGYEEGLAGLIHSFIENVSDYKVKLFIHPFDEI